MMRFTPEGRCQRPMIPSAIATCVRHHRNHNVAPHPNPQEEAYGHTYPYDWRTKLPCIYRATDQWFASVDGFRYAAELQ